ncbi:MAG: 4-hydroxylaminobenzoate lyase [Planctomycetota bacterium]|jgi:hypothetical protein
MDAIWTHLDPVIEHLNGCDLSDAEATRASLTETFGDLAELQALCRDNVDELCPREAGSTRFGRLAKDRSGFSVDTVLSSGRGMKHTHPKGEVNFCFAFAGEPKFDGHAPGWVVYGPGTTHPANVEGGAMFMIYLLPEGQIEWHK